MGAWLKYNEIKFYEGAARRKSQKKHHHDLTESYKLTDVYKRQVFDYVQCEGFGSVERLARTLANNGYRTIVIVGGDGAINDAINGIMTSIDVYKRQA